MLVVLQFPIADVRSFVDAPDTRLRTATDFAAIAAQLGGWDSGARPYFRHLGVLRRRQSGLDVAGEIMAFRGHRILRYPSGLHAVPHPRDGAAVPIRLLFRRFQPFDDGRDGHAHRLARYEIGWLLNVTANGQQPPTPSELNGLLDACLALPVDVAQYDEPGPAHRLHNVPLLDAGRRIARQLRWATVARPSSGVDLPPEWTIQACKPALLVEFGDQELDGEPAGAARVVFPAAADVRFHCQERRIAGQTAQCWYIRSHLANVEQASVSDDPDRAQQLRNVRVAVLRQHAEREVLACVLGHVALPDRLLVAAGDHGRSATLASARLREYLLNSAALLARRDRSQRQLPIAGDPATAIEPSDDSVLSGAAKVVDEADDYRWRSVQHRLSTVLGAETMASLRDALRLLPMGTLDADEKIAALVAAERPGPLDVAVSYAHDDERHTRILSRLQRATHRDVLEGVLRTWTDYRIEPGDQWRQEILDAFNRADAILMLLSPLFLKSRFCMEQEVPLALDLKRRRGTVVLPVEAVDCHGDWVNTPVAQLQVLQPWGRALTANGNHLAAWSVVRHALYRSMVRAGPRAPS